MKFLFLTITILFSFNSHALDCDKLIKIEYRENNRLIQIERKLCILNDGKSYLSSECLKHCIATSKRKPVSFKKQSGLGSPEHLDCHELGGTPMIASIFLKQIPVVTTLCTFNDGSMGTVDLIKAWNAKN